MDPRSKGPGRYGFKRKREKKCLYSPHVAQLSLSAQERGGDQRKILRPGGNAGHGARSPLRICLRFSQVGPGLTGRSWRLFLTSEVGDVSEISCCETIRASLLFSFLNVGTTFMERHLPQAPPNAGGLGGNAAGTVLAPVPAPARLQP